MILAEDEELDPNDADDDNSETLFVHLLSVQQITCPDDGAEALHDAEDPLGPEDLPG